MKRTLLTILMLTLVLLSACSGQVAAPTDEVTADTQPIKLGVSFPLTGEAASFGEGGTAGIELAVKEINEAGGINGRPIKVIYEDDKCSSHGVTALTKLVQVDEVDAVIGPICSPAAGPGLPVVQESSTPALIFASAPHLTLEKDFIFRVYPSDAFLGKFFAEYVLEELDSKDAALVYVKNDWGQGIRDEFVNEFKKLGGNLVFEDSIEQSAADARTILAKVKASNPEVIVSPLYPSNGVPFVKQAKELSIDVPIIGGDAWDADEFVKSGVTEGALITIGDIKNPAEFQSRAKQASGKNTNVITPLAYDAVKILAAVWKQVGTDKDAVRKALSEIQHLGVSTPLIEFDDNGDLKEAVYEVKIVQNGQSVKKV